MQEFDVNDYELLHVKKHVLYHNGIKRIISFLLSIIGMIFVGLSFLIVAPLIKNSDGGTIFYKSERLGLNGKVFKMYKYRSMRMNCEIIRNADGVTTDKDSNDPRVTKIGKIIRKFGIDELPQIINVFKGDMSFIGPRPDLTDTIDRLTGKIPNPMADITPDNFYENYYVVRMSVRPGITGYGPVFIPRSTNRVNKDIVDAWYAENMSFVLDLKVFFKTIYFLIVGKHR